jgi:biopolymer transport protein TolR
MNAPRNPNQSLAEINVTPLVDVVLVLLIIFMVLTPLAEKQMFMRVPEYEPSNLVAPQDVPHDQVVLLVKTDGRVLLNQNDLSPDEAMATLRRAFDGRPSKVLFLNAEDHAKYDQVVRIADEARKAGVNTIGVMTE